MIDFLKKVPLFSQLSDPQLQAVADICTRKTFPPGTTLFQEKEPGNVFYIVYSGSVKIYQSHTGGEKILSVFRTGDSFGELSLIDGKARSASAQTLESSVLVSLNSAQFQVLLRSNFEICLAIMQELCNRLRDTNEQVHDITFLDARTRVVKNLIKMANKGGTREGTTILIKTALNYDEMCQLANVQKPVLMQVLRDMQEKGIITFENNNIRLDLVKLRAK